MGKPRPREVKELNVDTILCLQSPAVLDASENLGGNKSLKKVLGFYLA